MPAGSDEDQRMAVGLQRRQRRLRFPGVNCARVGEALLVGELRPVVDHLDLDARQLGRLSGEAADVTGAEEIGDRRRADHFDEHVEAAAAHHAEIHAGVLVQIERDHSRPTGGHRLLGLADHGAFASAAADRADDRAVFAHQHLRRLVGRNRTGGVDDDRQGATAPRVALAYQFLVDVHRSDLLDGSGRRFERNAGARLADLGALRRIEIADAVLAFVRIDLEKLALVA